MEETIEKHLLIKGRVQGVGFRYFTRKRAQKLGIKGMVKNLPDGNVETILIGSPEEVDTMAGLLKSGPPRARVEEIEKLEPTGRTFHDFVVER